MDRIAATRRWAALGFILLSLLSRADAQTAIESRFFCSVSFEFSEVETYAHKILPDLPGPFSSVMIVADSFENYNRRRSTHGPYANYAYYYAICRSKFVCRDTIAAGPASASS